MTAKPLVTQPSPQSIVVSVDGGHVKSIRSYQMRSFEVMLPVMTKGSSSCLAASELRRIGNVNSSAASCVTLEQRP